MEQLSSSYRDNDGFVFKKDNKVYRLIRPSYYSDLQLLTESGLYKKLTSKNQLIRHEAAELNDLNEEGTVILPEQIPFISYAYEWSFDMWKDAALLTLNIAKASLDKGMILKDATPFNIQFHNGAPLFIDTLSFTKYNEGESWIAYRQFCECFLGPLLLMHYCHRDAAKLFLAYPNGIPLEIVKSLLPKKTRWNLHVYLHIHLQANVSAKAKKQSEEAKGNFPKQKLIVLLNGLHDFVSKLSLKKDKSVWDDYYTETILGETYLQAKNELVLKFANAATFETVTDLGANDGYFSMLLKDKAKLIIAADADSNCINEFYLQLKKAGIKNIMPVVNELNNPSPAIGWNNEEREKLSDRIKADLVMALALVHHLAIALNVPLPFIARWLAPMCSYLIIEFVPKSDPKVKQLLKNREDIFDSYSLEDFKKVFSADFEILKEERVGGTDRTLFLMKKR
jgi:hypothetical protein